MKESKLHQVYKKISIIFLAIQFTGISFIFSQAPDILWAKNSTGPGLEILTKAVTDENGDIYILGTFSDSIKIGSYQLSPNGNKSDFFIAKYNPNGDVIWVKSFGGLGDDFIYNGTFDNQGNLYVIGGFDSPQLIIGNTTLTSYKSDLLLIKLDKSGTVLWSKKFGGDDFEVGSGITSLQNGNIIIIGSYYGKIMNMGNLLTATPYCQINNKGTEFCAELKGNGAIVNSFNVGQCARGINTASSPFSCNYHIFTTKDGFILNQYGCGLPPTEYLVAITAGQYGSLHRTNCVIDKQGNIYITGDFFSGYSGYLSIYEKGSNKHITLYPKISNENIFIVKLSPDFKVLWAKNYEGNSSVFIFDCAVKDDGTLYITGGFRGADLFDGPNKLIANDTLNNLFIAELDSSGNINWTKTNNSGSTFGTYLAIDNNNNVYVAGLYEGECSLGNINLDKSIKENYNFFLCKLENLTSVHNLTSKDHINISPNPNNGTFQIDFTQSIQFNKVDLINMNGQVIWQNELKDIAERKTIELPSEIQSGMYILRFSRNDRDNVFRKVVIIR